MLPHQQYEWIAELLSVIYMEFRGDRSLCSEFSALVPSVNPFGSFVSVPKLGKGYADGGQSRGTENQLNLKKPHNESKKRITEAR